jgi:enoyl-CoA hydratase/carnithine racemase
VLHLAADGRAVGQDHRVATAVRVDVDRTGVAVLTLDGPERLNAFASGTGAALGAAYRAL